MGGLCSKEDQSTTIAPAKSASKEAKKQPHSVKIDKVKKTAAEGRDPQWIQQKRVAVAADAQEEDAEVEIPTIPKSDAQRAMIEKAVNGNVLFDMLSIPAKAAIIESMTQLTVSTGTSIIKQGDTVATKFYVLEEGRCDVFKATNGESPRRVHSYESGKSVLHRLKEGTEWVAA